MKKREYLAPRIDSSEVALEEGIAAASTQATARPGGAGYDRPTYNKWVEAPEFTHDWDID